MSDLPVNNVVPLSGVMPSAAGEPRPSLIAILKNLLAKAESGELQSLIGTGFTHERLCVAIWHDTHENVYEMLGALNWLEHEYVQRHVASTPEIIGL